MAISADGKIASANRRVSSFGSSEDHARLYQLRARADAVMTGASTVNEEDVDLNSGGVRFQRLRKRRRLRAENVRVIVSGRGRVRPQARVFREPGGPILILTTQQAPPKSVKALEERGAIVKAFGQHQLDWPAAMEWLRKTWRVRHLLCEGGADLNDSLFRSEMVDEVRVTLCPLILGGRNAPTLSEGLGFPTLREAFRLQLARVEKNDSEFFLTFERA